MFAGFRALRTTIKQQTVKFVAQRQSSPNYHASIKEIECEPVEVALPECLSLEHLTSDYFNYTSGRWLYDELSRFKERTVSFDIHALEAVAARASNRSVKDVAAFSKLAEGGFNRTFLITMTDGYEIIARIPYPVAFPSRLTVASEVATLGLVKLHGIPVPTVLEYSTTKDNPVGTEYIVMEKAAGTELGDRWFSLPDMDRAKIIGRLSRIESSLFQIPLPAYGSIFHKKDSSLLTECEDIPGTEFCVGPSVEQRWWHDRRGDVQTDRGPFFKAEHYLRAGAEKEVAWLTAHGRPRLPAREYREFVDYRKADPAEHIALLEKYLQIAPSLVPAGPEHDYLLKPTLRHPDINPRNIFVDEDLQITGLIDWQHACAVPLFLQAGVPDCFANFGDEDSIQLKKPSMPDDLSSLPEAEQQEQRELYRRRHLHWYYFSGAYKFNPDHYKALRHPSTALKQRLCFNASAPWQGNTIPLKTALMQASSKWHLITSAMKKATPCPISFPEEEIRECSRISAAQEDMDAKLEMLRGRIGISVDGWVPLCGFEHAVAENRRVKEEVLEGETEEEKRIVLENWPFDDHEEEE